MDAIIKHMLAKVLKKGNVAAGMVHEWKTIFYKSYMEK